ncbi:MAG: hypothetical protein Q4P26_09560 [Lachnospiraceae bacterium]|nr:hypothetical protein [Lachnospiraceae bacterium]
MKKKRILSVLLAAVLAVEAVPVGSGAEEIILDEFPPFVCFDKMEASVVLQSSLSRGRVLICFE